MAPRCHTLQDSRHAELRREVEAFHVEHPRVWELFKQFTFDRIERGFEHYGAKSIWERIRWETDQAQVDQAVSFKLNNNYPAFYARRFMVAFPHSTRGSSTCGHRRAGGPRRSTCRRWGRGAFGNKGE